jgi:ATP-dependent exoDNAse (exonuclease V) beta subunit
MIVKKVKQMTKKLYVLVPKNHKFIRLTVSSNLSALIKGNKNFNKPSIDEEYKTYGGLDYENSYMVVAEDPNKLKKLLKSMYKNNKIHIREKITGKTDIIDGRVLSDLKSVILTKQNKTLHEIFFQQGEGESKLKIKEIDLSKLNFSKDKGGEITQPFTNTQEQEQIKTYILENEKCNLKINAFAGTGKTSTLQIISKSLEENILYLAFNKSIAEEGKRKFSKNVTTMTTHSLALYGIRNYTNINIDNLKHNDYKPREISEYYEDKNYEYLKQLIDIFNTFCHSRETIESFFDDKEDEMLLNVLKLWNKMDSGELDFTHGFYLKKFDLLLQNNEIDITKYNTIMLDEAQDTNEVTLSIFKNIKAPRKIIVGDSHQQIYSFRGSVNLMSQFKGENLYLTETFRYNKEIARTVSNLLKEYKWEQEEIQSKIETNLDIKTTAYLFRTNADQIKCMANFLEEGRFFQTIRDPKLIFNQIIELAHFRRGEKDKIKTNKYLTFFETLDEITDYAEQINDISLKTSLKIIQQEGYTLSDLEQMLKKVREYNECNSSDTYLTTIHTAKGLEWDKVIISEDFSSIKDYMESEKDGGSILKQEWISNPDNIKYRISKEKKIKIIEEINLLYVAITRAKQVFEINNENKEILK